MARASDLLELARGELGVTESPAGSNKVKYNDAYGGGPKAWCCVFLWWLFDQAGAGGLFYGGGKTAYCPTLLSWYKKQGQLVSGPARPGDIVFFDFNGNGVADHVGLCERWDGDRITTIDGNTGEGNEANGGAVMRRTRSMSTVCAVARPAYEPERVAAECDSWATEAWLWATGAGLLDGTRPRDPMTRQEFAVVLRKIMEE